MHKRINYPEDKSKPHTEATERSSPTPGPAEASSSDAGVESPAQEKRSSLTKLKIVISCYQIVSGIHPLFPTIPFPSVRK